MSQGPDDRSCPFCSSRELSVETGLDNAQVHCDDCFAAGPLARTENEALTFWNRRDDPTLQDDVPS